MTVPSCSRCAEPAVETLRYAGTRLCRGHFLAFTDRRVKAEIRKQGALPRDSTIVVGVSGGKDSVTALHQVHAIFASRPDFTLHAVTVDEGINAYRPKGIEVARKHAKALGIDHHVVAYKDLVGVTMDEVHTRKQNGYGDCSYCGVFRRLALNRAARELGATRLVTGHNLDDMAQTILANLCSAEVERLARMGPHDRVVEGLVPRLMPLRSIPEKEVFLYALLRGFEVHSEECPYSSGAQRGLWRDVVFRLEAAIPGTRHALLNTYEKLKPLLRSQVDDAPVNVNRCSRCGEPAAHQVCQSCSMLEGLAGA